MQNILYLEISSVGICLLLIILFNQRQDIGSSTIQRQFNMLVYATIAILIVDAVCWLVDGASFPNAHYVVTGIQTLYYFLNIFVPYTWVVYLEVNLNQEQSQRYRRLRLLAIPLVLLTVLLFINRSTGTVFVIDESNVYHRSPGYLAYAIMSYIYLGYACVRAMVAARRARWIVEKRRYYPMVYFMVLPAVGGVIQIFFYGVTMIWIFVAISIMFLYIDSLNRQISTDPLTALNNRRELTKFIMRQTRDSAYEGVTAVIMIDVDGFKQVNDTYGHYFGDSVLTAVSEILKQSCKDTLAFLARYGGDEFCIVYPTDTIKAVETLIAEIRANINRFNSTDTLQVNLGLSIGYAIWNPDADQNMKNAFEHADEMMYREKSKKKGGRPPLL